MNEMLNAYRSSRAISAEYSSPYELVKMLFDGALERTARAMGHMERGEIALKGECLSRVVGMVGHLRESLDPTSAMARLRKTSTRSTTIFCAASPRPICITTRRRWRKSASCWVNCATPGARFHPISAIRRPRPLRPRSSHERGGSDG